MNAVADALRQRAHSIHLCSSPLFLERLPQHLQEECIPIGPSWEEDAADGETDVDASMSLTDRLRDRSVGIAHRFFGDAQQVADDLIAACKQRGRPDLFVFDYTLLGGPPAAEALRIPWAAVFGLTVPFSVDGWPPFGSHLQYSDASMDRIEYQRMNAHILQENQALYRPLRQLWADVGRNVVDPWEVYAHLPSAGIVGSVTECDFPRPGNFPAFTHYVGPLMQIDEGGQVLDAELREFLADRQRGPLVHITLGLTFSQAPEILRSIIDALSGQRLRLLVSTGHLDPSSIRAGLSTQAGTILCRRTFPHLAVFPSLDALVCHGGANTLMKALYFGVPSLIVPLGAEQRSNGARFCHAGIGILLLPKEMHAQQIQAAVRTLSDPAGPYKARATGLSRRAKELNGGREAARLLEHAVYARTS